METTLPLAAATTFAEYVPGEPGERLLDALEARPDHNLPHQIISTEFKDPYANIGTKIVHILRAPFMFVLGIIMCVGILLAIAIGGLFHKHGCKGFIIDHFVFVKKLCSPKTQRRALQKLHNLPAGLNGQAIMIDGKNQQYDAAMIEHADSATTEREWVIFVPGVASSWQHSAYRMKQIASQGFNVISANQRSVGTTPGHVLNTDDILEPLEACSRFLSKERGVEDSRKIGMGHSMGGGILIKSTSIERTDDNFSAQNFKGIIIDRSFTSFHKASKEFGPFPLNLLLAKFVDNIFPLKSKDHWSKFKGRVVNVCWPNDPIIHPKASIRNSDIRNRHTLYVYVKDLPFLKHHNTPYTNRSLKIIFRIFEKQHTQRAQQLKGWAQRIISMNKAAKVIQRARRVRAS
jgi:hypothetical protein